MTIVVLTIVVNNVCVMLLLVVITIVANNSRVVLIRWLSLGCVISCYSSVL